VRLDYFVEEESMGMIEVCGECGVPLMVGKELGWGDNGVIYARSSPNVRWAFFESENIDPLFRGIEEILGVPIEHIVIESRRRETKRYMKQVFPLEVRGIFEGGGETGEGTGRPMKAEEVEMKKAALKSINISATDISRVHGYGDQRTGDLWESGDEYPWRSEYIRKPFSLLLTAADFLGSVEAVEDIEMRVEYEDEGLDTYKITAYPGEHPIELKERLARNLYQFKPGEIHYEFCPQCGVPEAIRHYTWDLGEGTITGPGIGRRMAIFGTFSLDSIFDDLEYELGETIQEAIIEAGRRYAGNAWGNEEWRRDADSFHHMIALRGLGNLTRFDGDRHHLSLTIENSCLRLPLVGIIQALVEMAYGMDSSTYEWDYAEDGDLTVTVKL
jgi:hypothetical protein